MKSIAQHTSRWLMLVAMVFSLSGTLSAQNLMLLDGGLPGQELEIYLPTAPYPFGTPGPFGPLPLPGMLPMTPGLFGQGGLAISQPQSLVVGTDGNVLFYEYNPAYAPFTGLPPLPLPQPCPVLATGGPITGLAIDAQGGVLWMCDGFSFQPFSLPVPHVPLAPPILLPFATVGPPMSGLGFDPADGTLWACGIQGQIYHFTQAGVPIGPQPVAFVPAAGPLGGLAVNTSNGAGGFGIPFCSPQIPGFHICVTDGRFVYDALNPTLPPIPTLGTGAFPYGLGFSSDPQLIPGAGGPCISSGLFPQIQLDHAAHSGPGGLNQIHLINGPPLTTALLLFDICPIPGGLFLPLSGETLWINPFSPDFAFFPAFTDPLGDAFLFANFTFAPPGYQFCIQWAITDPAHPIGYCLSDAMTITSGLQ